jgi:GMP synthase-like glutamine amidotransferase
MLGEVLAATGYVLESREVFRGEPLPADLGPADILVVMGGPMGVADLGDASMPWLAAEVALLRERLVRGWPNLGVCLGMQLLAHAAGAKVAPMKDAAGGAVREVGWGRLDFHGTDAVTRGLPASIEVLHWHGDACGLPPGASLLASTKVCPVQMFRLGRSVGMQFHPEVDGPMAALWAEEDADFVRGANGPGGVAALQAGSVADAERSWAVRRRLLRQAVEAVTA